jgi:hypothetical protein
MEAIVQICLWLLAVSLLAGQALHAALAPGPDAFGYSVSATNAGNFSSATNGTRVLYFNDDTPITVNIGFNFNFYGSNYSTVSFSPNGLLTFGGSSPDFNNTNLATAPAPSNNLPCIAVLWDDWETESPGSDGVYYKTEGSAGNRQFVVQWNKVIPVNGTGTDPVTFQVRLFEDGNEILLAYPDVVVADDPAYGRGAFATVGIRDRDGQLNNRNLLWSYNQAVLTNGEFILFTRPNQAPIAVDDSATTPEDTPAVIDVLANDSDPDDNPLTIVAVTQGTNGLVTINSGTNLTYRPMTNYNGVDHFTYTITDGQGGWATSAVSVVITPVNDPPIAGADAFATYQDVPLTISAAALLTNDIDVDGDALSVSYVSLYSGAGGSVNRDGDVITYFPPADFLGADTFGYIASDGHGGSGIGTVSIQVWPRPRATGIVITGSGTMLAQFQGIPASNYLIQTSSDLLTWSNAAMRTADSDGAFSFEDGTGNEPARFYRIVTP